MSIRSITKDKHVIDFREGGRNSPRHMITYCGTRDDALAQELALKKHFKKMVRSGPHTCASISSEYLEWAEMQQSPKTVKEKRRMLNDRILPFFGHLQPGILTDKTIHAYKRHRIETTTRPTVNRAINLELLCLSAMLKWGARNNLCAPPDKWEPLPCEKRLPSVMSRGEVVSILNNMSGASRALYATMYYCGLRKDEITHLTPSDLAQDKTSLRIRGKGSRERVVPVVDDLRIILEKLDLSGRWLFPSRVRIRDGKRTDGALTDIRAPLRTALKKAGITKRVTPHHFRHSYATHLLESGADLRIIQRLLGHQSSKTTEVYTHVAMNTMREAVDRLGVVTCGDVVRKKGSRHRVTP